MKVHPARPRLFRPKQEITNLMMRKTILSCICLALFLSTPASADPILRLDIPREFGDDNAVLRPVWILSGTNGLGDVLLEASNGGDGNLNLQVSGSADWLTPQVGGLKACSFDLSRGCQVVNVLFQAAGLARGTYRATLTVSAPGAIDSPQQIPVTIHVDGSVPERVDLYVRPDPTSSESIEFQTPAGPSPTLTVEPNLAPNQRYLLVSSSGQGSFRFLHTHQLTGRFRQGLGVGDHEGAVTISGSAFPRDNRRVPVTLHVTNEPIAAPSATVLRFTTSQGRDATVQAIAVNNRGDGALAVSGVEATTVSGGAWLSAADQGGNLYFVAAATGDLAPGRYLGNLRFNSNAANGPTDVPVEFEVAAQGPPEVIFSSVVNGATFDNRFPVSHGAIVTLFGSQLASETAQASSVPLPGELGSAQVFVQGIEAPLFFVSYNQINFQIPFEAPGGFATVQVLRGGTAGNRVSVNIAPRAPGIFRLGVEQYGVVLNGSQGNNLPLPRELGALLNVAAAPARPGDFLVIYATGLGPVSPPVATGVGAPGQEPFARAVSIPRVNFGRTLFGPFADPVFVGLTPGFVGLFQINVQVPLNASTRERTPLTLEFPDGSRSNTVDIAVER